MGNCINSSLQKTLFHPQLGHLEKEYHDNYTIQFFKATSKLISKQKYQKWSSEVRKLKYNPQTKNFLYIPQKMIVRESDIFQNQTVAHIYYDPYIQTLEDLILRYKTKQQYPSQEMIWYLIYSFTKVGKYFEKISSKIGNINLSNIIINTNRDIKIICEKSSLQFIDPIEEVKLKLSDKVLLAPQEIEFLKKSVTKKQFEQINPQLSEVFSIGVLILSIANMTQPHKIYQYHLDSSEIPSIDFNKISTLLSNLKKNKRFSDLLIQTICQMIETKPIKRITSSQLFKRLSDYEHEILSKKGLHYSGQEIQKIKESLNGSFVSKNLNNSIQTGGNRSFQNNTHSFRVSEITQTIQEGKVSERQTKNKKNNLQSSTDFMNIL